MVTVLQNIVTKRESSLFKIRHLWHHAARNVACYIANQEPKSLTETPIVYKITSRDAWKVAEEAGVFEGAEIDLQDGYIHFSTAQQAAETAAKHFAGQQDLLLVAVDTSKLGSALKWERSRGDALFPHLYANLSLGHIIWVKPMPLDDSGSHILPLDEK